jgi:endonuclease YncB( thermonuclease family)
MMMLGLLLATALPCQAADEQQMRVFRVLDGDSLLLRDRTQSVRVQLAGIDAPELHQPGGQFSLKTLEKMVLGQRVKVTEVGLNTVGEPLVDVRMLKYDIALEMVRAGAAWASPDAGPELRAAEHQARLAGKGIWTLGAPTPMPPWQWRSEHGDAD